MIRDLNVSSNKSSFSVMEWDASRISDRATSQIKFISPWGKERSSKKINKNENLIIKMIKLLTETQDLLAVSQNLGQTGKLL